MTQKTMAIVDNNNTDQYKNWYLFTLVYILIDYGRPQDLFSPLEYLKPGMIIILILTWFLIAKGKLKEAQSKQTTLIWLFIILLALYIPFAHNNFFAYRTTKDMLLFMPFILSTIICVNSIDRLKKYIFISICVMIYVSLYSLTHGGRGSGNYFQDENDVSLYINMWIPFCFFLYTATKEKSIKILYLAGLITGILAVIISFSRGGFIGLVVVSFVCWMFSSKKILSLIVIGLLAILVLNFASDAYWHRMNTIENTDEGTAAIRIESWKAGWKMFLDNPWGVGGNNYQVKFPLYQTDYFKRAMWGRAAHSLWFTLMPELGIAGIIIYFLLLKYNLKDVFHLRKFTEDRQDADLNLQYLRALSAAFIAALAGFFTSGSFISVLYYPHYWYMTGMIVATIKIANTTAKKNHEREPRLYSAK
jgi:probable O-glycosylation ligase (exosortase A-associated)